jgi:hypothetical protein
LSGKVGTVAVVGSDIVMRPSDRRAALARVSRVIFMIALLMVKFEGTEIFCWR